MEFLLELFVTALIAVLFSFLVAKLVSMFISGDAGFDSESKSGTDIDEAIIMEELHFRQKLEAQGLESEKKVEFVEKIFKKVDQFQGASVQVETIVESGKHGEETVKECSQLPVELPAEVIKGEIAAVELLGKSLEGKMIVQRESKSNAYVEERNERKEVEETGNDDVVEKSEEIKAVETESKARNEEKNEELDFEDDDDWEGIERTELEKVFAAAAKYVEESVEKGDLASIGGDVQMELYGLHKVATEGTCLEPQPMVLKVSARTKWNAWQKLGNMNPEVAMEQYIALLSERVSGWMGESYAGKKSKLESAEAGTSCALATDLSSFSEYQTTSTDESCSDLKTDAGGSDPNGASSLVNSAKE